MTTERAPGIAKRARRLGAAVGIATALIAIGAGQADARMSVLFDETVHVNALTDPGLSDPLEPERDELYQQSIALRGQEFPANPANLDNPRDGNRFVAKAIAKVATASNCSNSYLVRASGDALSPEEMAEALRDGTAGVPPTTCADNVPPAPVQNGIATFESGLVFVEEVASNLWRSDHPSRLAPNFRAAVSEHLGEDSRRVHTYERFPQLFVASPEDWTDLAATRPRLGGVGTDDLEVGRLPERAQVVGGPEAHVGTPV